MRPLELDHPNRKLANEPCLGCRAPFPIFTGKATIILALYSCLADVAVHETLRLGRTLPEDRLRRSPFGILFKMPTTTTELPKNENEPAKANPDGPYAGTDRQQSGIGRN
jgi:hypothetical protein